MSPISRGPTTASRWNAAPGAAGSACHSPRSAPSGAATPLLRLTPSGLHHCLHGFAPRTTAERSRVLLRSRCSGPHSHVQVRQCDRESYRAVRAIRQEFVITT